MHRRDVLRIGAVLLAMPQIAGAFVSRAPMVRVFAGVSTGGAQIKGSMLDVRPDGTRDFVTLKGDLGAHAWHIFSIENANRRFVLWAMILEPAKDTWPYLLVGGSLRGATSMGTSGKLHTATFELDAATAERVAMDVQVQYVVRLTLDRGLAYAWSNPTRSKIRLRITNNGTFAIRTARSSTRFRFRAIEDGREVPVREVAVIDELTTLERVAPGAHLDLECDLRQWIDKPGTYLLDCAYDSQIFDDSDTAGTWPEHAAETWDIHATGALRVTIA